MFVVDFLLGFGNNAGEKWHHMTADKKKILPAIGPDMYFSNLINQVYVKNCFGQKFFVSCASHQNTKYDSFVRHSVICYCLWFIEMDSSVTGKIKFYIPDTTKNQFFPNRFHDYISEFLICDSQYSQHCQISKVKVLWSFV